MLNLSICLENQLFQLESSGNIVLRRHVYQSLCAICTQSLFTHSPQPGNCSFPQRTFPKSQPNTTCSKRSPTDPFKEYSNLEPEQKKW